MSEIINAFPGYELRTYKDSKGKLVYQNWYRETDLGLGGDVYAEPGMYSKVALLDIASLHPSSIVLLNKLGKYTKKYDDLRMARIYIKHGDYDAVGKLFDGKLKKYLENKEEAEALSAALKLPLNEFFGISFASFPNPARDSRDKNNIIALRGSLFMRTLQDEVLKRGFKVVHIKTDSIKIPNATDDIIKFVQDFARKYGYEMEHECTYDRMCLVNNAVYIAKYDDKGVRNKGGKKANKWTATGKQFQIPFIFKTLFSHEDLIFNDFCETKESKKGDIYIDMNEDLPNVEKFEDELAKASMMYEEGKLSDTSFEKRKAELLPEIAKGHNYIFVGRVGQFCPIKPGCGGGELFAYRNDTYNAVPGTKGYRWLESEVVKELGKDQDIDISYYERLADDAKEAIEQYGSFERFVSDEPLNIPLEDFINVPIGVEEDVPFT